MDMATIAEKFDSHARTVEAAILKATTTDSEIAVRLGEIEQKMARGGSSFRGSAPESWGQTVAASPGYKALSATHSGKARIQLELKTTLSTSATSGGALAPSDRKPGPNTLPHRRIRFRDALTPGRTDSTSVEYPRQTTRTNASATVAELALKPESALAWETINQPTRTIATTIPASKQILDDASMLMSVVDGELRFMLADTEEMQLLMGDGSGTNLAGVYPQATPFLPPFTLTGATMIDVLLLAIAQTQLAGFEPDSITLSPLDWARILAMKDGAGNYMGNGPFSPEQVARLWTIPVVATQAMTQNKFMVGASVGAQIFDRQDATVEISTEHSDFFARNMVLLRAEERLALAVYRSTAWTKGDFTAAITAAGG